MTLNSRFIPNGHDFFVKNKDQLMFIGEKILYNVNI